MSKQVFAFLKQSLTCKFNENLWPFQRANKKLWNLSTALSFKTDANSQRSCYFIARILMFFSLSHDFSMPLSRSRSTSRMEVNSILSRLCANASGKSSGWLRTANPEYSFSPPSRGLVSYDSVSDSFDEVGRNDGRLSGGSVDVFPDTEIPRPQV